MDEGEFTTGDEELASVRESEGFDPERGVLVTMSLPSGLRSMRRTILIVAMLFSGITIVPSLLMIILFWNDPEASRPVILAFSTAFFALGVFIILIFSSLMSSIHGMAFYSNGVSMKPFLRPPRFSPWSEFAGYRMNEWGLGRQQIDLLFQDGREMRINPTMHDFGKVVELVHARLIEIPKNSEEE